MTFDPYSSDSSSSDEDEPGSPSAMAGDSPQSSHKQKPRKHRASTQGPFSRFRIENEHFNTKGKVSKLDGRLKLSIHETVNSGYFAKTLGAGLRKSFKGSDDLETLDGASPEDEEVEKIAPEADSMEDPARRVRLNIVVIVIGSRGDIQPFLRIGKILKEDYGHRVRIATHPAFKDFVEQDSGLEFFSIGGDPSELMAFMVKNPGLIPNLETVREGEVGRRRAAMYEMFQGMWRACVNSTDNEDDQANLKMSEFSRFRSGSMLTAAVGDRDPFICDAIIANPPSFAPPHIAERLGVPLHLMFTYVPCLTKFSNANRLKIPILSYCSVPPPIGKHQDQQRGRQVYQFHELSPRRDDDLAGSRRPGQSIPIQNTSPRGSIDALGARPVVSTEGAVHIHGKSHGDSE